MDLTDFIEHFLFTCVIVSAVHIWYKKGTDGLLLAFITILKAGVPGLESLIGKLLSGEVRSFTKQVKITKEDGSSQSKTVLPKKGVPKEQLLEEMNALKSTEVYREEGKMFAYVYCGDDDNFVKAQKEAFDLFGEKTKLNAEHDELVRLYHNTFLHQNALNPMLFPIMRRFENEIIDMTASILHGDADTVGSLTSGGTESILMAVKTYRDRARKLMPHIETPELVAPVTIHPLHEKAAQYFGVRLVKVPVGEDCKPDIKQYENAITENTIGLLCSAPQICHGVVDPVESISYIALRRGLPLHVDATHGAFLLPWLRKLGYKVPKFDFEVPGVSSISTDIHSYGFGIKGCSVLLHRNTNLRKFQIFSYSKWPGGLFGSLSMAGTRGGAVIGAHWVTLQSLGEDGYCQFAKALLEIAQRFKEGICKISGLRILGDPHSPIIAITSGDAELDIFKVADQLESKGWNQERQRKPPSLKFSFQMYHSDVIEDLLKDIEECVNIVKKSGAVGATEQQEPKELRNKVILDELVPQCFNEIYTQSIL